MKYGKMFSGIVVLIAGIMAISAFASAMTVEMHQGMISTNVAKYTAVAYGNGTYVELWYNATGAYLNATAIDASTGQIVKNATISTDVYTSYGVPKINPEIAYDPVNKVFLVAWLNSSNCLEAKVIDSNLNEVMGEFNVNGTVGISHSSNFAVAYGNNTFLFTWEVYSSTSPDKYQLVGRFVSKENMSNVFRITSYSSYSQTNPSIGYDPVTKRFMVAWINKTKVSTTQYYYNITARIIDSNDANYTGDIYVGNALEKLLSSYPYCYCSSPAVTGGAGHFVVTYTSGLKYELNATFYSANGSMVAKVNVGHITGYSGSAPMPAIFNGSAFVMAWANYSGYIVSQAFYPNGTAATQMKIIYNGTNGRNPQVTYSPDNNTYMFSWAEYNRASYGLGYSVVSSDEYVPEFNWALPIMATLMVGAMVIIRKKH